MCGPSPISEENEHAERPRGPVEFNVPPMDAVEDLHGDPLSADLVVFFNGNQFMVLDELVAAFRAEARGVREVYYETLPPGVLVQQVRAGALRMGSLTISVAPDVLTAGPDQLATLHAEGWVGEATTYASNDLALLVARGDAKGVRALADLGREEVRIAMPNPATEGVGQLIVRALEAAGGAVLAGRVMRDKLARGQTLLTQIHHRESVRWLTEGQVDVAPLWSTEAHYHVSRGAPVKQIVIAPEHNRRGRYAAAVVERRSRHPELARAFVAFLRGETAQQIYRRAGFAAPMD